MGLRWWLCRFRSVAEAATAVERTVFERRRPDALAAVGMEVPRVVGLVPGAEVGLRPEALPGRIRPVVTILQAALWQAARARVVPRAARAPRQQVRAAQAEPCKPVRQAPARSARLAPVLRGRRPALAEAAGLVRRALPEPTVAARALRPVRPANPVAPAVQAALPPRQVTEVVPAPTRALRATLGWVVPPVSLPVGGGPDQPEHARPAPWTATG